MTIAIDAHEFDREIDIGPRRDLWTHPEIAIGVIVTNLRVMRECDRESDRGRQRQREERLPSQ
jgi:hypothetical protein